VAEPVAIRVDGLKQLAKALKSVDDDAPKELRKAANTAADIVVAAARPKVPSGPAKAGHALASVKAASTRTAARVRGGGNKYPYYPWLDFGGAGGKGKKNKRPYAKSGRYIWKSFAENKEKVTDQLAAALSKVAENSGFTVKDRG
jgi:hypothetical protein